MPGPADGEDVRPFDRDVESDVPPEVQEEVAFAVHSAVIEHGYVDLTVGKIAEYFAKSEALLYHYFDSKDEIVRLWFMGAPEGIEVVLAEIEETDPTERLYALCEMMASAYDETFRDLMIAWLEFAAFKHDEEWFREKSVESDDIQIAYIEETLAAGVETGAFRDLDVRQTAITIHALVDRAIWWDVVYGTEEMAEEARAALFAYLDDVVVAD